MRLILWVFQYWQGIFLKRACNCAVGSYISGLLLCRTRLRVFFGADSYRDVVGSSLRQGPVGPFSSGLRDNLDTDYLLRRRASLGG